MKKLPFISCIFLCVCLCAQKRINRPIEIYPYAIFSLNFSHLTNKSDKRITAPVQFGNPHNIGIKIERQFFKDSLGLFFNTGIFSMDIPVTVKYFFLQGRDGRGNRHTIIPTYDVWQTGLKKVINYKKEKPLHFNSEFGLRLLIGRGGENDTSYAKSQLLDSAISWQFMFEKRRKLTLVPYVAFGADYTYKKMKFGVQFWFQHAFTTIEQYDYQVKYGSYIFNSKAITKGMAFGANVYIKLISF